jgi:hypothetical protein
VVFTYNNIAITWSRQVIQVTVEVNQWEEEDLVVNGVAGDKHPF